MANSGLLKRRTGDMPRRRGDTGKLISAHYLEVEYLLDLVERAASHYQALGVERNATSEEVIAAYHKAIRILHPSYHKIRDSLPDELLTRVDQVFERISEAFILLTDFRKRAEYDQSLARRARTPLPFHAPKPRQPHTTSNTAKSARAETNGRASEGQPPQPKRASETQSRVSHNADSLPSQSSDGESVLIREASSHQAVYTVASTDAAREQRRRCERFKLSIPVLIAGTDHREGKWQEMTKSFDVSRMGLGVRMSRRLRTGTVVHITMPMPAKLRTHGYSDPSYNVYAIVRRVELAENDMRVVGLEFLGERPPSLYLHKPWATFQTQRWSGPDRRGETRAHRNEKVKIEYLDEDMRVTGRENGVTENISSGGARVCVKSVPDQCDVVKITCARCRFESRAVIRNRYTGRDGTERLCLQFLDNKWPM